MPRVLFLCPMPPLPVTGAPQRRFVSLLEGFAELGCETTVAHLGQPEAGQEIGYRQLGVRAVESHQYSPNDLRLGAMSWRIRRQWSRRAALTPALAFAPGLRRWFRRLTRSVQPDLILSNYAHWDGLIDRKAAGQALLVIDSLDLISVQQRLWRTLIPHFQFQGAGRPVAVGDAALRDDFDSIVDHKPELFEYRVYDRYHHTLAISPREAELLRTGCRRTRVHYLPMTLSPVPLTRTDGGVALFTMGADRLPIQGYAYFTKRVLPLVLKRLPDFRLRVVGPGCTNAVPTEGVELVGFAPDLADEFRKARFAINPILTGTGQPVKVVEAMAYGLPTVIMRWAEAASPLRHGVSGFVADTAADFADACVRLWTDADLRQRMGEAASADALAFHQAHHPTKILAQLLESAANPSDRRRLARHAEMARQPV